MRRALLAAIVSCAASAQAFCGFYVAGGGASLFNNATQVVLMRDGTKTILSMQNNYQGPPQDFAMVIPVPVVLQKENVKTLDREVFTRIDTLGAPRLVEYWEVDPCFVEPPTGLGLGFGVGGLGTKGRGGGTGGYGGVKIEAQFAVGEYEIVVLSAEDALGLERWLKDEKYKIPEGAAPLFRPYIEQGMKFFVAKVNVKKVTFDKSGPSTSLGTGMAQLSPLRFHYDSEKFELPIRLGLINAKAQQDLIVNVLAKQQRYEVANYPNVTIPTNIDLVPSAKSEFPFFYVSLFDRTLKANPKAVVTEYAWMAGTCDPCPGTPLGEQDFRALGGDVLTSKAPRYQFVLTRLHARYDKTSAGEDLVFKAAEPIVGGREFLTDGQKLEQGSSAARVNNFQARYAIRYPWKGAVKCEAPVYGRWGGPWDNKVAEKPAAASGTALITRDAKRVEKLAESAIAELQVKGLKTEAGKPLRTPTK